MIKIHNSTLLKNAKLFTMTADEPFEGFVLITDGKIDKVGKTGDEPECENIIDLSGRIITPGFIDAHSHMGMWEDGLGFEGDDGNEDTDPATPQLRAIDAINPTDRTFSEALMAGITSVITGPGSANPISGQMLAMKTMGSRVDEMVLRAPVAIKMAFGENPKTVYRGKNQTPVTRMATASIIRENLFKAKHYIEDKEKADKDSELDPPEFDFKCEALIPLLKREIPAHIHAHRADDMFTAIRIAKEFSLRFTIVHGTEAYTISDELSKDGVSVITGPFLCDRSKPELKKLTPENPGILAEKGIDTAICTDHPVIPIQYLPLTAGLAVREGMDYMKAMRAITITAAKLCGIDDRVGSIEPGKDADIAVFSCDPLSLMAKPEMVFVNGIKASI